MTSDPKMKKTASFSLNRSLILYAKKSKIHRRRADLPYLQSGYGKSAAFSDPFGLPLLDPDLAGDLGKIPLQDLCLLSYAEPLASLGWS
jgi:hypothetical protein